MISTAQQQQQEHSGVYCVVFITIASSFAPDNRFSVNPCRKPVHHDVTAPRPRYQIARVKWCGRIWG